jgi:hypothetical protein
MPRIHGRLAILCAGLTLNHFQNGFHFDDVHTITENPFIRDVRNIRRFFVNPYLFSLQAQCHIPSGDRRVDFELAKKNLRRAETGSGR